MEQKLKIQSVPFSQRIKIDENRSFTNIVSASYLAIELLENDKEFSKSITTVC